ncbi:activator of Hsp90 ATPase [Trametes gibbosa]|nr:activator of Hsp90 ATPase [Trametes gibbosa]
MSAVPAPLPPSTANWHWKNKTVTPWAKRWFEQELTAVSVSGEGTEMVSIESVAEVDGDVELGQRKSKLITIYDCRVVLNWEGTASDGTAVSGKLTIPEVSHEITLDGTSDYVYEWSITTSRTPAVDSLFKLAKARLPAALEAKFSAFPAAIIDTHGKDLTVSADPSRQGSPAPSAPAVPAAAVAAKSAGGDAAPKKKATNAGAVKSSGQALNTTTVTVDAHFMAPADDLYAILTDEKRIPQWTRAPAKSIPEPGSEYSLFAGNVKGKYVSVSPPKAVVQTWALENPTWPDDHFATLTTTLDQGSDSTKVTWHLSGVPLGMEEEITRNLQGY